MIKNKYCIYIIEPPQKQFIHVFDEVALGLYYAFKELDIEATLINGNISPLDNYPKPIILGGNLIKFYPDMKFPEGAIIFNMEQLHPQSPWLSKEYIELMQTHEVWDYDSQNIEFLKTLGINAKYCGIGYVPELTKIKPQKEDIDILFIGSLNDRRLKILRDLHINTNCVVKALFNAYENARDKYIARAKIILNIHFYETKIFEIVRCSYLLANNKFIISEEIDNKKTMDYFKDGIAFTGYDRLIDTVIESLNKPELRSKIAGEGFNKFRGLKQVDYLKAALNQR